jgi:hypothetical protein
MTAIVDYQLTRWFVFVPVDTMRELYFAQERADD